MVLLSCSAFILVVVCLQSTLNGMAWVNAHWVRDVCKLYCVGKADCSASAGSESMKGLVRVGAVFLCFFVSLFLCFFVSLFLRCLFCCLFLCHSDTVCFLRVFAWFCGSICDLVYMCAAKTSIMNKKCDWRRAVCSLVCHMVVTLEMVTLPHGC